MEPNKGQTPNKGTQHQEETGTTKKVADYNKSQQGAHGVIHGADETERAATDTERKDDILGGKEDGTAAEDSGSPRQDK